MVAITTTTKTTIIPLLAVRISALIMIISTVILYRRIFLEQNHQVSPWTAISKVWEKAWIRGSSCLTRAAITTEIKRMMKMKNVLSIQKNSKEIHPLRRVKVHRIFHNNYKNRCKITITIKQTNSCNSP